MNSATRSSELAALRAAAIREFNDANRLTTVQNLIRTDWVANQTEIQIELTSLVCDEAVTAGVRKAALKQLGLFHGTPVSVRVTDAVLADYARMLRPSVTA
jgi:sugar (pentulose or hexulose) kinase